MYFMRFRVYDYADSIHQDWSVLCRSHCLLYRVIPSLVSKLSRFHQRSPPRDLSAACQLFRANSEHVDG